MKAEQHQFEISFPSTGNRKRKISISSRSKIYATEVFDTYWKFASARQSLFFHRLNGSPPPWTDDQILLEHRFTNAYRASDRVSQYLIKNVIYEGSQNPSEVFFRTILFKLFNKIDTWERIRKELGTPTWRKFDFEKYAAIGDQILHQKNKLYSAAYIMPSPPFGSPKKHRNHLRLIEHMMKDGAPRKISKAKSLSSVFEILKDYPSIGDFLAFQFTIDLNYSQMIDFSEMDFVVAGPGAKSGIKKCFHNSSAIPESVIIQAVCEMAGSEFQRLGLNFKSLWGRPLHPIDCQNLFCEVDKYSRVAHPEFNQGRSRIKQKFSPSDKPLKQWYPPKWNLKVPKHLTF